jgi:hypothetical protein
MLQFFMLASLTKIKENAFSPAGFWTNGRPPNCAPLGRSRRHRRSDSGVADPTVQLDGPLLRVRVSLLCQSDSETSGPKVI